MQSAKTIVIDIADNHGNGLVMGIRSVGFMLSASPVTVLSADITCYAKSSTSGFGPELAFDSSYLKTGYASGASWKSAMFSATNQRIICVFDTPIDFDSIVVNNFHDSGNETTTGAKNIKVYRTDNTVTSTTYNESVSGGVLLFDSVIDEHTYSDAVDDQYIYEDLSQSNEIASTIGMSDSVGLKISYAPDAIMAMSALIRSTVNGPIYYPSSDMLFDSSTVMTIKFNISANIESSIQTSFKKTWNPSFSLDLTYYEPTYKIYFPVQSTMKDRPRLTYGKMAIIYPTPEQTYPISVVVNKYRCMLGDLEIPVSTFQIRARNGTPTFLQISTSRFDMADEISSRSDEDISVHIDYYVDGVVIDTIELAEVNFDLMKTYEGPSSKSIVLSGNKTVWKRQPMKGGLSLPADYELGEGEVAIASVTGGTRYPPPNSVTIPDSNVSLISTSGGNTTLELVETDFSLEVGDIVHHSGSASFFANIITHIVSSSVHKIFVSE